MHLSFHCLLCCAFPWHDLWIMPCISHFLLLAVLCIPNFLVLATVHFSLLCCLVWHSCLCRDVLGNFCCRKHESSFYACTCGCSLNICISAFTSACHNLKQMLMQGFPGQMQACCCCSARGEWLPASIMHRGSRNLGTLFTKAEYRCQRTSEEIFDRKLYHSSLGFFYTISLCLHIRSCTVCWHKLYNILQLLMSQVWRRHSSEAHAPTRFPPS